MNFSGPDMAPEVKTHTHTHSRDVAVERGDSAFADLICPQLKVTCISEFCPHMSKVVMILHVLARGLHQPCPHTSKVVTILHDVLTRGLRQPCEKSFLWCQLSKSFCSESGVFPILVLSWCDHPEHNLNAIKRHTKNVAALRSPPLSPYWSHSNVIWGITRSAVSTCSLSSFSLFRR